MKDIVVVCLLAAIVVVHGQGTTFSWEGPHSNPNTNPNRENNVCLTNQASCGCCLMQKQMHNIESFFNHSLNSLKASLNRVKHVLDNVRASRSAFSVALTDNAWECFGAFREVRPVVYEHVFINLGDDYNVATGVFTVPRSGVYSLALTVYSDAGVPGSSLHACAKMTVNGNIVVNTSETNRQDQEDSTTAVLAMQLTAGDRVSVILPIGCKLCDSKSHFNTFSGFLLYATN